MKRKPLKRGSLKLKHIITLNLIIFKSFVLSPDINKEVKQKANEQGQIHVTMTPLKETTK